MLVFTKQKQMTQYRQEHGCSLVPITTLSEADNIKTTTTVRYVVRNTSVQDTSGSFFSSHFWISLYRANASAGHVLDGGSVCRSRYFIFVQSRARMAHILPSVHGFAITSYSRSSLVVAGVLYGRRMSPRPSGRRGRDQAGACCTARSAQLGIDNSAFSTQVPPFTPNGRVSFSGPTLAAQSATKQKTARQLSEVSPSGASPPKRIDGTVGQSCKVLRDR